MQAGKVKLEFWMADRLDWTGPEPMVIEEGLADGDSLRSVLGRLAGRISRFLESVFDPETQSLSSEMNIDNISTLRISCVHCKEESLNHGCHQHGSIRVR